MINKSIIFKCFSFSLCGFCLFDGKNTVYELHSTTISFCLVGLEPRVLDLLGKRSTIVSCSWSMPSTMFEVHNILLVARCLPALWNTLRLLDVFDITTINSLTSMWKQRINTHHGYPNNALVKIALKYRRRCSSLAEHFYSIILVRAYTQWYPFKSFKFRQRWNETL